MKSYTTAEIFSRPTGLFLEKHIGHPWYTRSVDPDEYGMLGEPVSILPVSSTYSATHYQSQPLSPEVATITAERLGEFGFTNPEHFTKIDTGLGYTVLLLTQAGVAHALNHETFKKDTTHSPIIGDTGIREKS
jgi:hypothetical protein